MKEIGDIANQWKLGHTAETVGGGESPDDVAARVLTATSAVLQEYKGKTVLLVGHSWVNKAFIASVLPSIGLPLLLGVPQRNCAVNVVDFTLSEDGGPCFKVHGVDLLAGSTPRL